MVSGKLSAMTTADNYPLIDNDQSLDEHCQLWSSCHRLGIDTEFIRTRTYYAKLGLVQVFDGDQCYLIDPLGINNLTPLFDVFANKKILKILHSCSEDLEIFARLAGRAPVPLYDTQIAAALCGLGPSLGYRGLVEKLVGEKLAKTEQRSDWLKRPLTPSQLRYAAMDVLHLLELEEWLAERLRSLGRVDWAAEENLRIGCKSESDDDIDEQFKRFRVAWKLTPLGAEILYRLVRWRDQTARSRDIPRSHVLPDDALLDIAFEQPDSVEVFNRNTRASSRAGARYGEQLVALVKEAGNAPESSFHRPPPPPLDLAKRRLVKQMRQLVSDTAAELNLAVETLASRRDLVHLIQTGELPTRLDGWRTEIIGEQLLHLRNN